MLYGVIFQQFVESWELWFSMHGGFLGHLQLQNHPGAIVEFCRALKIFQNHCTWHKNEQIMKTHVFQALGSDPGKIRCAG